MEANSDSVCLGWGLGSCISNLFPSDANVAGLKINFVGSEAGTKNSMSLRFLHLICD